MGSIMLQAEHFELVSLPAQTGAQCDKLVMHHVVQQMHSDPPATLPTTKEKPVEDRSQPHKTRRTILP